ncbi:MAG: acetyl-CoA carboxylase biotin carboxylase subunit [Candidatus Zixiibacteriota bacterium]
MPNKIKKILIANRGEIAIRVIRACRDAGIISVAVYSECDKTALNVRLADEAYFVGPSPSNKSYLVQENIIAAAKKSGADAIHPGYGFLAENAQFAKLCEDNGIIFIGPKPETIALLGDKLEARKLAVAAGLPVVPGIEFDNSQIDKVGVQAKKIGYPVLIKAAAGGGGKGMRVVEDKSTLKESIQSAIREAGSAFGDGRVFLEKYLEKPRHIEIQILTDSHGGAIYLGERECSIQRRHQKVIEESPSPVVTEELRRRMGMAAVNIAKESNYLGAGTVEFLVDKNLDFYFLEVNTRLQVEHPVTEMVTGIDLVREQFAIAEGRPMSITQDDIKPNGHAIECRIYAEDASQNFMPSIGLITEYREPSGPGIRVDSGVVAGMEIPMFYDPIISKMVVWGNSRLEAIERTIRALTEYRISGVNTTIEFAYAVMHSERFRAGDLSTDFIDREFPDRQFSVNTEHKVFRAAMASVLYEYIKSGQVSNTIDDNGNSLWVKNYRGDGIKRLK